MTNKCALTLTRRWLYLLFGVGVVSHAIFFLANGSMPVATTHIIGANEPWLERSLPIQLPRFIDLVVMLIPFGLCAWLSFTSEKRDQRRHEKYGRHWEINTLTSIYIGWFFGLFGANFVMIGGVIGAVLGSITSVVLIAHTTITWYINNRGYTGYGATEKAGGEKPHNYRAMNQVSLTIGFAILLIWGITTFLQGTVAGLIYATTLTICSFVTYYAIIGIWLTFLGHIGPQLVNRFKRTMLQCDIGDEVC